jgi:methionyl-tRNA formyltransferase
VARLVYLGTPALAVPPLRALVAAGHEIALVVSQPDARRGRGGATSPSPVKQAALDLGLAVSDEPSDVLDVGADAGVVVAYGRILRPEVVHAFPLLNLHFSDLPRWRGAAPVERAILAGDATTAVCVMAIEEGLDTGAVYARQVVDVGRADLETLRGTLVDLGAALLVSCLADGVAGLPVPSPQVGEPTTAKKVQPAELVLDLNQPADQLDRTIRLGKAYAFDAGRRLRILRATPAEGDLAPGALEGTHLGTGRGVLALEVVQPEGKAPMDAAAWSRGRRSEALLGGGGEPRVKA